MTATSSEDDYHSRPHVRRKLPGDQQVHSPRCHPEIGMLCMLTPTLYDVVDNPKSIQGTAVMINEAHSPMCNVEPMTYLSPSLLSSPV